MIRWLWLLALVMTFLQAAIAFLPSGGGEYLCDLFLRLLLLDDIAVSKHGCLNCLFPVIVQLPARATYCWIAEGLQRS